MSSKGIYHVVILHRTKLICASLDYSDTSKARMEGRVVYYYMLLKMLDLFDTVRLEDYRTILLSEKSIFDFYHICQFSGHSMKVFIILRKNKKQLSFLHVYHHAIMVFAGFFGSVWVPGGAILWLGLINVFVHGIMYFYYFLTAFNPEMKKSIWWKRNLTQIQLVFLLYFKIQYIQHSLQISFFCFFSFALWSQDSVPLFRHDLHHWSTG